MLPKQNILSSLNCYASNKLTENIFHRSLSKLWKISSVTCNKAIKISLNSHNEMN